MIEDAVSFIKTNMGQSLNQSLLARDYKVRGWWLSVNHALMLLGVCAPLTTKRIGTVLIAATHTSDFKEPWGSHPSIDNNIAWADVKVIHDGYELSRQEKIKYIAKYPEYLTHLKVCFSSGSNYNCCRCEKCLRTIIALILEGRDPKKCNFNIDDLKIFKYIKACLVKGKFEDGKNEIFMWQDIQEHIPEQFNNDMQGSKEFFTWFKGFDLSKYRMNKLQHFLWTFWINFHLVIEYGVMKTIKRAPRFIVRKLVLKLISKPK